MQIDLPAWEFRIGRIPWFWRTGRADARTVEVPLPHSWNADDTFRKGVRYYRGSGHYRRQLTLPREVPPGRWIFRTGGFYGTGTLYVNGKKHSSFDCQFIGVELDVTDALKPGASHWFALDLTNDCSRSVLPGIREPDFVLHGGLAAEAWLERRPSAHFLPDGAWAWLGSDGEQVGVVAEIGNSGGNRASVTAECRILDQAGTEIARQDLPVQLKSGARQEVVWSFRLPGLRYWSPDDPHRYAIQLVLSSSEGSVDRMEFKSGFRQAEFRKNQGFFLNGRRLMLRGINRHENMPGFGNAVPLTVHEVDAALIKDMGLNLVRLSHYPQHPHFLDECDRLGILVYAEIATWKSVRGGSWLKNARRQMESMIRRDRRHPSVILWGLGNESQHREAYRQLDELAHRLDPTRATIYAENHLYRAKRRKTFASTDVYGLNYEVEAYAEARRLSRNQVILISEIANLPDTVPGDAAAEASQVDLLRRSLDLMNGLPGLAGFCIWCLADYATMRKKRYLRYSGVVDAWRNPKAAVAFLRETFRSAGRES